MLAHLARVQVLVVGGRQIQTTGGDRHVDLGMGEPILSSRIDLVQRLGQDRGLLLQAQFDGSGHSCADTAEGRGGFACIDHFCSGNAKKTL